MARTSTKKTTTTTTSATVDETMVADNSQNVVVENSDNVEKKKAKTKKDIVVAEPTTDVMTEKIEEMVKETVAQLTKNQEEEPLQDTDDIEVKALIPNVSYKDSKTLDYYEWRQAGDIEEIPFEILKNMFRNHRGYFRNLWLKPLDERIIEKFKLGKIYSNFEKLIDIENYTIENVEEMCDKIHELPSSAKSTILTMLRDNIDKGELTDIHMIKKLESKLKIDLISLI